MSVMLVFRKLFLMLQILPVRLWCSIIVFLKLRVLIVWMIVNVRLKLLIMIAGWLFWGLVFIQIMLMCLLHRQSIGLINWFILDILNFLMNWMLLIQAFLEMLLMNWLHLLSFSSDKLLEFSYFIWRYKSYLISNMHRSSHILKVHNSLGLSRN